MTFNSDPYYYHTYVELNLVTETPKAYLLDIKGTSVWIPKKICKGFTGSSAYIHEEIFNKNMKQAKQKNYGQYENFKKPTVFKDIPIHFDAKQLKLLISLCHPDKHKNSENANLITKLLLEKRKK